MRLCLEGCLYCNYELRSGSEVCLDTFVKEVGEQKAIAESCHTSYDKSACAQYGVKLATFLATLQSKGTMEVHYDQLSGLSETLIDYLALQTNVTNFLGKLFRVELEKEVEPFLRYEFVLNKSLRAI